MGRRQRVRIDWQGPCALCSALLVFPRLGEGVLNPCSCPRGGGCEFGGPTNSGRDTGRPRQTAAAEDQCLTGGASAVGLVLELRARFYWRSTLTYLVRLQDRPDRGLAVWGGCGARFHCTSSSPPPSLGMVWVPSRGQGELPGSEGGAHHRLDE